MRTWSQAKRRVLFKQFKYLIKNEFSLYLWQAGSVIPLTLDTLDYLYDPDVLNNITPEFPDTIIKAATVWRGPSAANTLLLDKDWLNYLLDPEATREFGFRISELLALDDSEADSLFKIRQSTGQNQEKLIYDESSSRILHMLLEKSAILEKARMHTAGEDFRNVDTLIYTESLGMLNFMGVTPQEYLKKFSLANLKTYLFPPGNCKPWL